MSRLLILFGALAGGLIWWALHDASPADAVHSSRSRTRPTGDDRDRRRVAPVDPAATDAERQPAGSPLQRRLRAGTEFRQARAAGTPLKSALPALLRARLHADALDEAMLEWPDAARDVMTKPRRDLESFRLVTPARDNGWLRVWAPEGNVTKDDAQRYHDLALFWHKLFGGKVGPGTDLVFAKDLGRGLFPHLPPRPGTVGLYYPSDEMAFVDTNVFGANRVRTAQHELAHALLHRWGIHTPYLFVEEGLAGYLEFSEPNDVSLHIPPARMRRELGWTRRLVLKFHRRGALPKGTLHPWVQLNRFGFSRATWLHYPLALSAFAYLGGDELEACLRARDMRRLAASLGKIQWSDLLEFLQRQGDAWVDKRPFFVSDPPLNESPATAAEKMPESASGLLAATSKSVSGSHGDALVKEWLKESPQRISIWVNDERAFVRGKSAGAVWWRTAVNRATGSSHNLSTRSLRAEPYANAKRLTDWLREDQPELLFVAFDEEWSTYERERKRKRKRRGRDTFPDDVVRLRKALESVPVPPRVVVVDLGSETPLRLVEAWAAALMPEPGTARDVAMWRVGGG